jgi:hypothetical protein
VRGRVVFLDQSSQIPEMLMNRTVKILGVVSLCLLAAAVLVWRLGSGAGFMPVADPTDLMFSEQEGPGAIWMEIGMVLALLGLSTSVATIRYWLRNRDELKGFTGGGTGIIPRS